VVSVISIFGCVQNKFRNKPYVTCPVYLFLYEEISRCLHHFLVEINHFSIRVGDEVKLCLAFQSLKLSLDIRIFIFDVAQNAKEILTFLLNK
jgi:hypothetical protein